MQVTTSCDKCWARHQYMPNIEHVASNDIFIGDSAVTKSNIDTFGCQVHSPFCRMHVDVDMRVRSLEQRQQVPPRLKGLWDRQPETPHELCLRAHH